MTEVARQFRKDPTPSEAILWQALRGRKLEGRKFRRQQPIGAFVVDFFCGTERLIVEVDGGIHESQKEADRQRQELLESLGLRLVRISSELVETSLDQVLLLIRQAFFPHPLTPSPTLGEGGQEESLTPLSLSGRGAGGEGVPRFSKVARSYLLHIGNLDWKQINPDIFGSMIQAIAQEEERGALGMHYTSVPNILKVLNPLFLDDLRAQLESAGDNARKLLNLRQRLSKIRVFDPACGSGNFLVIAYKEMRAIEATINQRRGEADRRSKIPLTNFRGIEIRHFAVEVARLALIIAEYQCDVLYRGPKLALAEFLPLKSENWITCGNALRLDWLSLCPPTGTGVKLVAEDLFSTPLEQTEIDFANEGGETYLCGNPPYQGSVNQTSEQKEDMRQVFASIFKNYKDLDYVAAFMLQAARFNRITSSSNAFVTTNSITQGEQVALLWPLIYGQDNHIHFAHTSFQWSNLASNKAAVTCVIVGLTTAQTQKKILFSGDVVYEVVSISPYLAPGTEIIVEKRSSSIHSLTRMDYGNKPTDGGNLILSKTEYQDFITHYPELKSLIREYIGSRDFIHSIRRYCFWIEAETLELALNNPEIKDRLERVRALRSESRGKQANQHAKAPHRFVFCPHTDNLGIVIPRHVSENRAFLTVGLVKGDSHVIADSASAIYDANLVDFAVLSSHLHLVWIATVCGKLKTDFRYSNTLGWNTFPVPTLTDRNKADLTRCAEDILLAREQYFPAAIADMYDPDRMDSEFPLVREAHDRNDEVLERIYIGRRFKNDTERLEKLFELYTKMTNQKAPAKKSTKRK
jgi:very-short-patch-repair endonuclease